MQLDKEVKSLKDQHCRYMKGHQDITKKQHKSMLPELYNVQADAKATIMQSEMTKPASYIILFPASQINIYMCSSS
jgi:hypothetical protein